jgi:predicted DNA-binding transcriptional regulator AlpA
MSVQTAAVTPSAPEDATILLSALSRQIGRSPRTILGWAKAGSFPQPIRLGPRTTLFLVREVRQWLEGRKGVGV